MLLFTLQTNLYYNVIVLRFGIFSEVYCCFGFCTAYLLENNYDLSLVGPHTEPINPKRYVIGHAVRPDPVGCSVVTCTL